jgi:glycosyltransferase involved in cell wall biosynthesis
MIESIYKHFMKRKKAALISLIIPAYKQEKTIKKDLLRILSIMDQIRYKYEIIVVVDGFLDKTFENAKKVKSSKIHISGYEKNYGKGHAVRVGMSKAKGDIVAFIDSGMDLHPNGLSMLLEHFEWYNADIIVGSKRHPVSKVNYPFTRRIVSYVSQLYIRFLFGLNVRDTQVGMKFFRRKVIEDVLPRLLVKKFAFDIEILAVSYYLGYRRIYEAPIQLNFNFKNSGVSQNLFRAIVRTFWDTLAIFYRLKILRYYDNANRKQWRQQAYFNYRILTS